MFCALEGSGRELLENELALCIADAYPVSAGHSLVIPRRHGADGLAKADFTHESPRRGDGDQPSARCTCPSLGIDCQRLLAEPLLGKGQQ